MTYSSSNVEEFVGAVTVEIDRQAALLAEAGLGIEQPLMRRAFDQAFAGANLRTVERVLRSRDDIVKKCKDPDVPRALSTSADVMFGLLDDALDGDTLGKGGKVASVVLSYFLTPLDLVCDHVEGVGYVDDVIFMLLGVLEIAPVFLAYCETHGFSADILFAND